MGRLENVRVQGVAAWRGGDLIAEAQEQQFFHLLPALGALSVGLAGLAWQSRKRREEFSMGALVGYAAVAWLIWIVVMFLPGSAAIHHGSYSTTLLLFAGGAIGLAGWGRFGTTLLIVNVVAFALLWLAPRAGIPVLGWNPTAILLFAVSSLSLVLLSKRWFSGEPVASSRH
jgi:hypothetical protein